MATLLGCILLAGLSPANAALISGDGDEACFSPLLPGAGPNCTAQNVTLHPGWQPNNPMGNGAQWISYADTGYLGSTLAVAPGGDVTNSVMQIRESITGVTAGARLILNVWADDTADIALRYDDGSGEFTGAQLTTLFAPNFTQDHYCTNGPIGCEPGEGARIEYVFTPADIALAGTGEFYLLFTTFQVGSGTTNHDNPFGLLYSGQISTVPLPPAFWLFGSGMLGLAACARRRQSGTACRAHV
ncbi:MAG: VPLPA-CTERM sorting domain-containing protein [Pseudomonadota bacterium]